MGSFTSGLIIESRVWGWEDSFHLGWAIIELRTHPPSSAGNPCFRDGTVMGRRECDDSRLQWMNCRWNSYASLSLCRAAGGVGKAFCREYGRIECGVQACERNACTALRRCGGAARNRMTLAVCSNSKSRIASRSLAWSYECPSFRSIRVSPAR